MPPVDQDCRPRQCATCRRKSARSSARSASIYDRILQCWSFADGSANPAWFAADLIAQAEHGAGAPLHSRHHRKGPGRPAVAAEG
ncbi:hypothetical protein FPZ08_00065 [Devosia ginsengisoli]|uniref:Uncharacterized protein n=1 Tax=Devosia ginsengisoli TaxID=400770 RepID=A0A5B8M0D8_9HYPH|nr:hypothetical protein FPZ08_00065 [Devosia ginsengisoli]